MKTPLVTLLCALAFAGAIHAKVRFDYRSDQRVNPAGQTVISIPFTLEDTGNLGVVMTAQCAPTSEIPGHISGQIRLDGSNFGGFAGMVVQPQLLYTATTVDFFNNVAAGNHTVTVFYTNFTNATTAITTLLLIYDDGGLPTFTVGDNTLTLEEFLNYLEATLLQEMSDRLAADEALQVYVDGIAAFLEGRIETLEDQVADLMAQGSPTEQIEQLRAELLAYIDAVRTLLESRIGELEQRLAGLTDDVGANASLIVQVQNLLQTNIDTLQTLLDARITHLESQLAVLLTQSHANAQRIEDVRTELLAYLHEVRILLEGRVTSLETQLASLTTQVNAHAALILHVQTQLEANINALRVLLEGRIASLEAQLAILIAQGNANADLIVQIRQDLESTILNLQQVLGDRITQLETLVATLVQNGNANAALIAQLQTELAQVRIHVQQLDSRLAALEGRPRPAVNSNTELLARIDALSSRVTGLESQVSALDSRVSQQDAKIRGLNQNGDGELGIETFLIPAAVGVGSSVLVNAIWPREGFEEAPQSKDVKPRSAEPSRKERTRDESSAPRNGDRATHGTKVR
jgi:uncharacterized coiled-coil protein SlyX